MDVTAVLLFVRAPYPHTEWCPGLPVPARLTLSSHTQGSSPGETEELSQAFHHWAGNNTSHSMTFKRGFISLQRTDPNFTIRLSNNLFGSSSPGKGTEFSHRLFIYPLRLRKTLPKPLKLVLFFLQGAFLRNIFSKITKGLIHEVLCAYSVLRSALTQLWFSTGPQEWLWKHQWHQQPVGPESHLLFIQNYSAVGVTDSYMGRLTEDREQLLCVISNHQKKVRVEPLDFKQAIHCYQILRLYSSSNTICQKANTLIKSS